MLITAMKTALIFVADLPLLNKSRRLLQELLETSKTANTNGKHNPT